MAKKMYVSPLFSGGLVDGGDHVEPYTNSQETYSPDNPTNTLPDMSELDIDQITNVMSLPLSQIREIAGGDDKITLAEYQAFFPAAPSEPTTGDPE